MVLVLQSVGLRLKRGFSSSHNFGLRSRSRCQCKAPKQNPKLQNTSRKLHSKLLAFHMLSSICNFEPQKKDHSIMRFGIPRLYWRIMNRREIMPASLPDPWCEMLHHRSTQNICRQPSAALYFYDAYPPLSSAINLRSMHYDGPLKHGCKCALCTQSCGEACQLPKSGAKIRRVHFVAPLQKHAEDTSYKIQVWLILITTGPNWVLYFWSHLASDNTWLNMV